MKIALPVAGDGVVSALADADAFDIVEVDLVERTASSAWRRAARQRSGNQLADWLAGEGVDLVITPALEAPERGLLEGRGVRVLTGAPCLTPRELVKAYLNDELVGEAAGAKA